VPEATLEILEQDARADIGKELEKVRQKLDYYIEIQESPDYEEAEIVRKKPKRKPYRALGTALAQELGVPVPKSAKTIGKTWKEIYEELQKQKNNGKGTWETS
jgi:hypothetical protein